MDPLLQQDQEVEALQAIYGDDFSERPDKAIWNRPAFAIRIQPVGLADEGIKAHATLTVKVLWVGFSWIDAWADAVVVFDGRRRRQA